VPHSYLPTTLAFSAIRLHTTTATTPTRHGFCALFSAGRCAFARSLAAHHPSPLPLDIYAAIMRLRLFPDISFCYGCCSTTTPPAWLAFNASLWDCHCVACQTHLTHTNCRPFLLCPSSYLPTCLCPAAHGLPGTYRPRHHRCRLGSLIYYRPPMCRTMRLPPHRVLLPSSSPTYSHYLPSYQNTPITPSWAAPPVDAPHNGCNHAVGTDAASTT